MHHFGSEHNFVHYVYSPGGVACYLFRKMFKHDYSVKLNDLDLLCFHRAG